MISLAGASHIGARAENQDFYCLGPNISQGGGEALELALSGDEFQKYGALCAVADGMGGVAGGKFAACSVLSNLAAQFYSQSYGAKNLTGDEFVHDFALDFPIVNQRLQSDLIDESRANPNVSLDAGATLAGIALLPPDLGVLFWCGDARVLRYSGGYIRQITRDHSPLWDAVARGEISEDEAALSPSANRVSRAMGIQGDTRVEIELFRFQESDLFLLCSDGVHGLGRGLRAVQIRDILRETENELPLLRVQQILRAALEADGRDNATLCTLQVLPKLN